jgi:hypothetical protein
MADVITLESVQQSFAEFARANDASIDLAYSDEKLMISRCVLPMQFEVRTGDTVKGGVAVRGTALEVEVRPYLLRQICTNGAVMMRSSGGSTVATEACTDAWLNEAFAAAGSKEALATAANEVRTLAGTSLDMTFMLVTFMQHMGGRYGERLKEMLHRATKEGLSGFSLMNAITSVARDTPDPDTRWRLEALGGGLPALLLDGPTARERRDALDLPDFAHDEDCRLQHA